MKGILGILGKFLDGTPFVNALASKTHICALLAMYPYLMTMAGQAPAPQTWIGAGQLFGQSAVFLLAGWLMGWRDHGVKKNGEPPTKV